MSSSYNNNTSLAETYNDEAYCQECAKRCARLRNMVGLQYSDSDTDTYSSGYNSMSDNEGDFSDTEDNNSNDLVELESEKQNLVPEWISERFASLSSATKKQLASAFGKPAQDQVLLNMLQRMINICTTNEIPDQEAVNFVKNTAMLAGMSHQVLEEMSLGQLCTYVSGHLTELKDAIVSQIGYVDVSELLSQQGLLMEMAKGNDYVTDDWDKLLILPVKVRVKRYKKRVVVDLIYLLEHLRNLPKGAAMTLPDKTRVIASDEAKPDLKTLERVNEFLERFGIQNSGTVQWDQIPGYDPVKGTISLNEARKSKWESQLAHVITKANTWYYWFNMGKVAVNVASVAAMGVVGRNVAQMGEPFYFKMMGMPLGDPVNIVMWNVITMLLSMALPMAYNKFKDRFLDDKTMFDIQTTAPVQSTVIDFSDID